MALVSGDSELECLVDFFPDVVVVEGSQDDFEDGRYFVLVGFVPFDSFLCESGVVGFGLQFVGHDVQFRK